MQAVLTLTGTLAEIQDAVKLLLAGEHIRVLQEKPVEEPLNEAEQRLMTTMPKITGVEAADSIKGLKPPPAETPSEAALAAEAAQEKQLAPAPRGKKYKFAPPLVTEAPDKKRKRKAKAEKPEPEHMPDGGPDANPPKPNGADHPIPAIDVLQRVVVDAYKKAKAAKDDGFFALVEEFKARTGLPFIMDASTDEHRQALYDLVTKAGIEINA